ncbi:MAG: hypothetical protein JXA21_20165 [Anaerolineae bacterium]|nr:hypothetical protein [Anaerolineae bacterium]
MATPGSIYRGTRFDWTAFITQVTLDAVPFGVPGVKPSPGHTFCVAESFAPERGTGGVGLCNEFGIEMPVGYDDAHPGETFPKIGIGLLARPENPPDAPYQFFRPYAIAQEFPVSIEARDNWARFTVEPLACRGYAARLVKTVSVEANTLSIAYALENVGQKPIVTHEYCHNFTGIDEQALGPDYSLSTPYPIALETVPERPQSTTANLEIVGNTLRCRSIPQHSFYARLQGFAQTNEPQWTLTHVPSGVTMKEYDDFTPARVAVWGMLHVFSAEVFVDINLLPGETQQWTRRYTFDD